MGRERFVDAPPSGNTLGVYQNGGFMDSLSSIPSPSPPSGNTLGVYQNGGFMDSLSSIPSPSPAKSVEEPAHSATTLED